MTEILWGKPPNLHVPVTIMLSDRAPVTVTEAEWPVYGRARCEGCGCWVEVRREQKRVEKGWNLGWRWLVYGGAPGRPYLGTLVEPTGEPQMAETLAMMCHAMGHTRLASELLQGCAPVRL